VRATPKHVPSPALDWLGVMASSLCIAHCALLPLLILVLPAAGMGWIASESLSRTAIAIAAVVAAVALVRGRRAHGRCGPLVIAALGVAALVAGDVLAETSLVWGVVLAVAGGGTVASAHLGSIRLCRACATVAPHHGRQSPRTTLREPGRVGGRSTLISRPTADPVLARGVGDEGWVKGT
jgi:hypothetical protein